MSRYFCEFRSFSVARKKLPPGKTPEMTFVFKKEADL
jgi:hypothetical protein